MTKESRKIVIIGAGIAGLCTAVYARQCGYDVQVLEQHDTAGGLATSWRRGDYTFETSLHWLLGSNPGQSMYSRWQEVFDISRLTFWHPEEYVHLETDRGESLSVYSNVDRMETELLEQAPRDAGEIRRFAMAVRRFAKLPLPDPTAGWARQWTAVMRTLPNLALLRRWSGISLREYGRHFVHPLLRAFFENSEPADLSALTLIFALARMSERDGGYPIGGSQAIIRPIADNLHRLGGRLQLGARVERILAERNTAIGVRLAGGESIRADWVISAADGHSTIYSLLGGEHTDPATDRLYRAGRTFPSYVQVSLGVARDLSGRPGYVKRLLEEPLVVDPATGIRQVSFRFFHFDPTFAPRGKTAVTCLLPTSNYQFWVNLRQQDPARYHAEKRRVADAVIALLGRGEPNIRQAIEIIDVSTPATVIRITGNWKGSTQGWVLTPGMPFRPLRRTLPELRQFLMVGQWMMPGGGLPSGLMTARSAIQWVCKSDRVPFAIRPVRQ